MGNFLKNVYVCILATERNEPNYLATLWHCPKICRARFPVPRSHEVVSNRSRTITKPGDRLLAEPCRSEETCRRTLAQNPVAECSRSHTLHYSHRDCSAVKGASWRERESERVGSEGAQTRLADLIQTTGATEITFAHTSLLPPSVAHCTRVMVRTLSDGRETSNIAVEGEANQVIVSD